MLSRSFLERSRESLRQLQELWRSVDMHWGFRILGKEGGHADVMDTFWFRGKKVEDRRTAQMFRVGKFIFAVMRRSELDLRKEERRAA
jgi:hypothetical protein